MQINFLTNERQTRLTLKARINYNHEDGSAPLMTIKVNDIPITADNLKNKPPTKYYKGGRKFPWYDAKFNGWNIQYSPDFFSNYLHKYYSVINGDPYLFTFNIEHIKPIEENRYMMEISHKGLEGKEAWKNDIIIKEIEMFE